MKDSMIEKLGITPGPWEASGANHHIVFKGAMIIADCQTNNMNKRWIPENTNLIAAAPEMLERDINWIAGIGRLIQSCESNGENEKAKGLKMALDFFSFEPDQKATGKSWEEIKELL